MALTTSFVAMGDGEQQDSGLTHFSYSVLGQTVLNATDYTKVEFTDMDANKSVIAWFSQQGVVGRVDVLGDKNYTGPNAPLYAQTFTSSFSSITTVSYNATLLSGLQRASESTQSIGPTQMDVATYRLATPNSAFSNFTVEIATVPGANVQLAVYSYQQTPDLSTSAFQVTSVTRA